MKGLTEKQFEIAEFIRGYVNHYGFSPSYREIQNHFGFASLSSVSDHVRALKRKGVLSFQKYSARSVTLEGNSRECPVSLIGLLKDGLELELFAQCQSLPFPRQMIPHPQNSYALKVITSSLHEELIDNGDLLIIETRSEAENGETAFLTVGGMNLVKKIFFEGDDIMLKSRFDGVDPILVRSSLIEVRGIVVAVIRSY